jgi:hypothetical protein
MASGRGPHCTYYLDLALVSQNQAGNYSTINVHYYAIADSGWSGFSNTPIAWSTSVGPSGAVTFNGTSIQWCNFNVNIGHDANGYASGTVTAASNATGTSTYGGPASLAQGFTLPRIPKVPSAPSLAVAVSGRTATLTVGAPADNGGSGITNYVTQYTFTAAAGSVPSTGPPAIAPTPTSSRAPTYSGRTQ